MEDILASIKRIIADDAALPTVEAEKPAPRVRRPVAEAASAPPILELVDPVMPPPPPAAPEPEPEVPHTAHAAMVPPPPPEAEPEAPTIVSERAAVASRQSLAALSALVVKPGAGQALTMDDLVRDMLRPMLKEWLDARLPEMVEKLVAREIARITGGSL